MINFDTIDYLKNGNQKQQLVYKILTSYKIFDKLVGFTPILTGTIPIEIDIDESDLDIICYWENKNEFVCAVELFKQFENYTMEIIVVNGFETIIAEFEIEGYRFEIFGQNRPVKEQEAYWHMIIEAQILDFKGSDFKNKIIELKKNGMKTEPAFGLLLGLKNNPYKELLEYKLV